MSSEIRYFGMLLAVIMKLLKNLLILNDQNTGDETINNDPQFDCKSYLAFRKSITDKNIFAIRKLTASVLGLE